MRDKKVREGEENIESVMLARGSEEYALRVIDRAIPPERASFPQPTVWMVAGVFLGSVLAMVFLLGRRAWTETGSR